MMFVKQHEESVNGVILLASYVSEGSDLSMSTISVLSIYTERDGLTEHVILRGNYLQAPSLSKLKVAITHNLACIE